MVWNIWIIFHILGIIIPTFIPTGWWFGTFGLFFHILGISSSQLTNSYFSEGQVYHQPDYIECIDDVGTLGWSRLLYAMGHWSTSQHSWTSTLISLDPVPIKEPSKTGSDSGLTCSIFCPYCLYCNYCCYCFNYKVFKLLIPVEFAVSREGI